MQDTNIESLEWEIWKDIPWYEWYYQISTFWRVKSIERYVKNWNGFRIEYAKILFWSNDLFWYTLVGLSFTWINRRFRIHRLMWITFLWINIWSEFIPSKSLCVCHKDDNPSNNRLDNLFLWTLSENSKDRHNKWRTKPPLHHRNMFWKNNHSTKIVIQYSKDMEKIAEYYWSWEAWRATWTQPWNIRACCRWKVPSAWWYIWRYWV